MLPVPAFCYRYPRVGLLDVFTPYHNIPKRTQARIREDTGGLHCISSEMAGQYKYGLEQYMEEPTSDQNNLFINDSLLVCFYQLVYPLASEVLVNMTSAGPNEKGT